MKIPNENFFIQSQSRNDFLTPEKSISSNQKSAVKMNQSVRNAQVLVGAFQSQKFEEFPQVYTGFLAK